MSCWPATGTPCTPERASVASDPQLEVQQRAPPRLRQPLHVQRVITNISSNAVKYNRVGGTINYTLDELPQDAIPRRLPLHDSDTNIGMSEFSGTSMNRWRRSSVETPAPSLEGTGLGMAITARLVQT